MLDHQRGDRRHLDHLVPMGCRILSPQQGAAAAAGIRVVLDYLVNALDLQQLRPSEGMALLPTTLAATALAAESWLKPRSVTGGRPGGVTPLTADPLAQAGQFRRQGGELLAELFVLPAQHLNFLPLLQDQNVGTGRPRQPVRC
jgi:hypothetical protein